MVMLSPGEEVEHGLGLAEGTQNALAVKTVSRWRPMKVEATAKSLLERSQH